MRKNNLKFKSMVILFLMTSWIALAQEISIKGNVQDQSGAPIPGVNILVKNTTKGASTDFNGNFVINGVKIGNTLTFSYLGYITKEIIVTDKSNLTVQLIEDLAQLDEVVIIGYGTQKKSVVTGAISGVKQSEARRFTNYQSGTNFTR